MHEIGDGSKWGECRESRDPATCAPLQVARAKFTINDGQSAILPRKSKPRQIFRKTIVGSESVKTARLADRDASQQSRG